MEKEIGKVIRYFSKLQVAIVELADGLKVGDKIKFKGHTTDFDQTVDSIQIEHKQVEEAKSGDSVGIKVTDHVREDDKVLLVQ